MLVTELIGIVVSDYGAKEYTRYSWLFVVAELVSGTQLNFLGNLYCCKCSHHVDFILYHEDINLLNEKNIRLICFI